MRVYFRRKLIRQSLVFIGILVVFAVPMVVFGQAENYDIALGTKTPTEIAVTIINWFLTLLALVAVVLLIYGGFVWMTAGGNPEKVKKAKKILVSTGIGLLIILSSWGIVQYVLGILGDATGTGGEFSFGGPGDGYLESGNPFHINTTDPRDEEFDVPLCQIVTVGFSLPLDEDIASEQDGDEYTNFSLKIRDGAVGGSACSVNADCSSAVCGGGTCDGEQVPGTMEFSESSEYLVFFPFVDYEENTTYRVELTTSIATLPEEGGYELSGTDPNRVFEFSTGTTTDTEPPTVSVGGGFPPFPGDGDTEICRETPIQVTFNESLDVTSVDNDSVWLFGTPEAVDPTQDITLSSAGFSSLEDGDPETDDTNNTFVIYPGSTLDPTTPYGVNLYSGDAADNFTGSIRDTCGNPLDGDFDGTAEGSTTDNFIPPADAQEAVDAGYEYKWIFTTGETAECTPEIDSISPPSGFYSEDEDPFGVTGAEDSDLVTLTGSFLYPFTDLEFVTNISAAETSCFDTDHDVAMTCVVSGTPSEVVVRTPVGSVTGAISVENDSGSDESDSEYEIESPFIYALSPGSGPVGQFITIRGDNFVNDAVGSVFFDGVEAELPCADGWDDDEIIVEVPEGFNSGDFPEIQVVRRDGRHSNFALFEVTSGDPGPGLCEISPDCSDTGVDNVTLTGKGFGDEGEVFFTDNEADLNSYTDTEIVTFSTPVTDQDTYEVGVVARGTQSNGIFFDVPCPTSGIPSVKNSSSCDVENDLYPSPNPRPGARDVCLEVVIAIEFEGVDGMQRSPTHPYGVRNPDNFKVYSCEDESCSDYGADDEITGTRTNDPGNLGLGFRFYPTTNLEGATTYLGWVSGNVTSTDGVEMGEDYSWTFTTQDGNEACPLDYVDVSPADIILNSDGDNEAVEATPYGPDCTILSGNDYTWAWSSENEEIVTVWDVTSYQSTVRAAGGDRENEGVSNVSAETEGVSGFEPVTVDLGYCESDADCDACADSICDEGANRCTPVIETADPGNVDNGDWVTLSGCYFGPDPGSIVIGGETVGFPDPDLCSDTWSDDEVIFEVPESLSFDQYDIELTSTYELVDTLTGEFEIDGTSHPGLCRVDPDEGYNGDSILLTGQEFGTGSGACETAFESSHVLPIVRAFVNRTVAFYNTYVAPVRALAGDCDKPVGARVRYTGANASDFSQWIDNYITNLVPDGASTGTVKVRASADGEFSNSMDFTVQCDSDSDCGDGYQCVEGICEALDYCVTDGDCSACAGSSCDEDTHTCTPVIENVSPDSGPEGRAVTINGCYFGATQGDSTVTVDGLDASTACGELSWNNEYVVVTIPEGVSGDEFNDMDVLLNKVVDASEFESNATTFSETVDCVEIDDDNTIPIPSSGIPVLCQATPDEGERGDLMSLEGEFYSVPPAPSGEVFFTDPEDENNQDSDTFVAGDITAGGTFDHQVDVIVPAEAPGGTDEVTLVVDSCPSNSIDVEIDARPFVKATNPEDGDSDVCINAQTQVTFSDEMDASTLTLGDNVVVYNGDGNIDGEIDSYTNGDGETVMLFTQSEFFNSDEDVNVEIVGDNAIDDEAEMGVLSSDGLGMDGSQIFTFHTSTSDGPCEISYVEIDPDDHTFSEGGTDGAQDFSATAYSDDDQALSSIPGYSWTWFWEEDEVADIISIDDPVSDITEVTADSNGDTSLYATADIDDSDDEFTGFANITVFFCADPVVFDTDFYSDGYFMEMYYCQDDYTVALNDSLVEVDNPGGGALAEWFLLSDDTDDAIGVRVFGNNDRRLMPGDWFEENVPNPDASYNEVSVDDFDAIQVGRTFYVGGSNKSGGNAYPNIYVFSYNQDADPETEAIFSDLLDNLTFNSVATANQKESMKLATKRITNLGSIAKDLEEFYEANGHYPKMQAGTFTKYLSTSAWPSWDSRLGNALGATIPEDPENEFTPNPSGCTGDDFDETTCFDSIAGVFECPNPSNIYLYKTNEDADEAWLYSSLESPVSGWGDVNYTKADDPCSSSYITNAECSCFDYQVEHSGGISSF